MASCIRYKFLFFLLLLVACNPLPKPKVDWSVNLSREGKNPYDTHIAYHSVRYYFPNAQVKPIYSDFDFTRINTDNGNSQVGHSMLVLVGHSVQFSKSEWQSVLLFMRKGNEVLFLASQFDEQIQSQFGFSSVAGNYIVPLSQNNSGKDNVNVLSLASIPEHQFGFRGRDIKGFFELQPKDSMALILPDEDVTIDKKARILGKTKQQFSLSKISNDSNLSPNFIQYSVGAGHLTLIATPLVFSNYFLLQTQNRPYLEAIWQAIDGEVYQVYWGNFKYRIPNESIFSILWRNMATRLSLLVFLFLALSYLIIQTKRKQRIVPVIAEPSNSTLAFIETIGMLYYNKGDNHNLAVKMEQHFMEWVRTKFNLNTHTLDAYFVQQLSIKSAVPLDRVQVLIGLIHQIRLGSNKVSDEMLFELYQQIQQFYKTN